MKSISRTLSTLGFAALLATATPLWASGDHGHDGHGGHDDHGMEESHGDGHGHKDHGDHDDGMKMGKMFLKKKRVDGYDVSFHVMKAKPGKEMGGSHDFMIKVEKDGKPVKVVMNTKVVHPNGKSETKKTMKMGDWMMAGYDLGEKGKYQLMILFKTADGKKHKAGVYYP